jgi:hypothetical protein
MAYWVTGFRKVNGKTRKVRKLIVAGKVKAVRVYGHANYTDKTARRRGNKRVAGRYNATSRARKASYPMPMHRMWGSLVPS